jgi:hypothetical protein
MLRPFLAKYAQGFNLCSDIGPKSVGFVGLVRRCKVRRHPKAANLLYLIDPVFERP